MPVSPQKLAGIRTEPPPSLPVASVQSPAARAAAAPPLEPPAVRSVSQGLRQASPSLFSVLPDRPNSGVLVLPRIIAPADRTQRRRYAFGHFQVFYGYGYALELPQRFSSLRGRLRGFGGGQSLLRA